MINSTKFTTEYIVNNFTPKKYKTCQLATKDRPYTIFDEEKTDCFIKNKELAVTRLGKLIDNAQTEEEITECLFITDKMLKQGTKNMDNFVYKMSKFHNEKSGNVQTFLAGVYRHYLHPDGFAPMFKMMVDNIKNPQKDLSFNPNEEVGGTVLDYLRDAFQKNLPNKQNLNTNYNK